MDREGDREGPAVAWALHHADCLDVLRAMASASVDHVICDPPYEDEAHTKQRRVRRGPGNRNCKVEALDFEPITADMRASVAREIARLTRRWVLVFCQVEAAMLWRDALVAGGLNYRRTAIWLKPDGMPQLTGDRPGMGYESIVIMHRPGRSRWNCGGRTGLFVANKSDMPSRVDGRAPHPTTKPVSVMLDLVESFTDHGETVLDPFAGSGTTGVAAMRLGRSFIGVEKDPRYYEIARDRLAAEERGLSLHSARMKQSSIFDRLEGGAALARGRRP